MFWTCSEERWWIHWTKDVELPCRRKRRSQRRCCHGICLSHGIINAQSYMVHNITLRLDLRNCRVSVWGFLAQHSQTSLLMNWWWAGINWAQLCCVGLPMSHWFPASSVIFTLFPWHLSQAEENMSHPREADPEKEFLEKLFDECEDEFYATFGVYDGKS